MATQGFALAAAIGVQTALPDDEVWVLVQDDDLQATVQELATVRQEQLPIRVAVLNRGYSAASDKVCGHPFARITKHGWGKLGPDWVRLAGAYGIPGLAARSKQEARSAISRAHASPGAFLIDLQLA
jgi:acetolactate synthase-1/2/3 large subunit